MPTIEVNSWSIEEAIVLDADTAEKGDGATLILNDNGGIWERHNDWLTGMASPVCVRTEDEHQQVIRIERAKGRGQWRIDCVNQRPKQLAFIRGNQTLHLSRHRACSIQITVIECPHGKEEFAVAKVPTL